MTYLEKQPHNNYLLVYLFLYASIFNVQKIMNYAPMPKFGYAEEMLQTRLIENMREKQESLQKLSHTKTEKNENDMIKLSTKMIYLEQKILHCETKLETFRDTLSYEGDKIKNIVQLLYDKGLFDNFPNKDQVF